MYSNNLYIAKSGLYTSQSSRLEERCRSENFSGVDRWKCVALGMDPVCRLWQEAPPFMLYWDQPMTRR